MDLSVPKGNQIIILNMTMSKSFVIVLVWSSKKKMYGSYASIIFQNLCNALDPGYGLDLFGYQWFKY
jgi:hypothetical protein